MKKFMAYCFICLVVILGFRGDSISKVKPEVKASIPAQTAEIQETQEIEKVEEITNQKVEETSILEKGQDRSGTIKNDEDGNAIPDYKDVTTYDGFNGKTEANTVGDEYFENDNKTIVIPQNEEEATESSTTDNGNTNNSSSTVDTDDNNTQTKIGTEMSDEAFPEDSDIIWQ